MKTVNFGDYKYIGDPINAVRIFNEKEVDEIMVLDIDASREGREPNYALVRSLAAECRMPLSYGGGVRHPEQFERLVSLGVEKVAISSAAIETPELIAESAERVGGQSVAVVVDVKKVGLFGSYRVFTHNGKINTGLDPVGFSRRVEELGAGEIIVNSIDRDGTMQGYDIDIIKRIRQSTNRPMTVLGGAGSLDHMKLVWNEVGSVGAAAGSLFVFKGVYRAVLINYPSRSEKDAIISN